MNTSREKSREALNILKGLFVQVLFWTLILFSFSLLANYLFDVFLDAG